jgi:ParB-like chromosome segregation protein Spo0J
LNHTVKSENSPDFSHNPVSHVRWVPLEKVHANDYNPNAVAAMELELLYISIKHDGYTQPVVCAHDPEADRYEIVDGFHRYTVMKRHRDLYELNHGHLPVVVIDKPINDRMASTIRHNRARGKHAIAGMSQLVVDLLRNGWSDRRVCEELGLEKEELIRLKHITGYAKFFEGGKYSPAVMSDQQIEEYIKFENERTDTDRDGDSSRP